MAKQPKTGKTAPGPGSDRGRRGSRRLKVFRTPIGFHDAYVAAPSQKAALAAWGADSNLFAQGIAEQVTDPELMAGALERPGEVVRRLRDGDGEGEPVLGCSGKAKAPSPPSRSARAALSRANYGDSALFPFRPRLAGLKPRPLPSSIDLIHCALPIGRPTDSAFLSRIVRSSSSADSSNAAISGILASTGAASVTPSAPRPRSALVLDQGQSTARSARPARTGFIAT